ncbi:hypothetical protein Gotri_027129 [Gossypium trilobum]|uniref:Uncharacterized protein n=1 Tax=Gossypium trilobum TaxID=34281 RepID=A0A7J9FN84_9ROSI|nr:hypothetical protein [Gossypium trilobum]
MCQHIRCQRKKQKAWV